MPLVQGASRRAIHRNIEIEMAHGKPHNQALAIALDVARRSRGINLSAAARRRLRKKRKQRQ